MKLFFKCILTAFFCFTSLQAIVPHDDFVVITPEKTGTHLLTKALEQLLDMRLHNSWEHKLPNDQLIQLLKETKSRGQFLHIHARPHKSLISTLIMMNYKVIFLMRDPRDQAVSLLHFIEKGWSYGPLNLTQTYGQLNIEEKLHEIISGTRFGLSATKEIIKKNMRWLTLKSSFVYKARFENLVGAEGGGSREAQLQEIKGIVNHLSIQMPDEEIAIRSLGLFGKPGEKTFRSGQIGEWRNHFLPIHKQVFKRVFGKKLIKLGYEKDMNW